MKKILIFWLLLVSVAGYSQRTGSITVAADLDTTIFIEARNGNYLEFDITGIDADTDSLWLGYSNDTKGFVAATGFPVVLVKDPYKQYVNGVWRYRIGLYTTGKWPGIYAVIRYKRVGSTADLVIPYSFK